MTKSTLTNSPQALVSLISIIIIAQILILRMGYLDLYDAKNYWEVVPYILYGITIQQILRFLFTYKGLISIQFTLREFISLNLIPIIFGLLYMLVFFNTLLVIAIYLLFWSILIFFRDY